MTTIKSGDGSAEDGEQQHGEDERGNGHQHVHRAAGRLVIPAAQHRRHDAGGAAQKKRQQRGNQGDADGVSRAVNQAGHHVAAEVVGAEEELLAPQIKLRPDDFRFPVGRQHRRENRHEDVDENNDEAELGGEGRFL